MSLLVTEGQDRALVARVPTPRRRPPLARRILVGSWRLLAAGFDWLARQHPFAAFFLLVIASNLSGSIFNIYYNIVVIAGRHMNREQEAAFNNVAIPLYNQMLLASLNPSLAHVRGVNVKLLEYAFVLLVTILTVACVKIVGAVLVEALLLIPAAASRNLNRTTRGFVIWSVVFSTLSCVAGVYVPMRFDLPLPSGGAIILAAAIIFLVTMIVRMTFPRFREASL